jgi:hypothetical protein
MVALLPGMITVSCILFALLAAVFFLEITTASAAPLGYQDEGGFHFGRPNVTSSVAGELENPS